MSHGDLAHSGLYAYAYAHWGLRAPTYTTLPVQAMARIAATEDIEGIREEEDVGDEPPEAELSPPPEDAELLEDSSAPSDGSQVARKIHPKMGKYVATVQEVHDAFDSVNVLRYSQPCHLQGQSLFRDLSARSLLINSYATKGNVKVSLYSLSTLDIHSVARYGRYALPPQEPFSMPWISITCVNGIWMGLSLCVMLVVAVDLAFLKAFNALTY